jgi:prevent-host-death family protein
MGNKKVLAEPQPEGDYAVRRTNSERASDILPTQAEAIKRAKELSHGGAPLVERARSTGGGEPDKWRKATFTELRNHTKDYFDAVESGDKVRVFRNGKPIAEIVPIRSGVLSWKRQATPLTIEGVSLSGEILSDREESA